MRSVQFAFHKPTEIDQIGQMKAEEETNLDQQWLEGHGVHVLLEVLLQELKDEVESRILVDHV